MKKLMHNNKLIIVILILIVVTLFASVRSFNSKEKVVTKSKEREAPTETGKSPTPTPKPIPDCPDYEDTSKSQEMINRYGASYHFSSDGSYIFFFINPHDFDESVQSKIEFVKFELVLVNGNKVDDKKLFMTKGSPMQIPVSTLMAYGEDTEACEVVFKSSKVDFDPRCKGSVYLRWNIENPTASSMDLTIPGGDYVPVDIPADTVDHSLDGVNCNKPASQYTEFEESYCGLMGSINTGVSQGKTKVISADQINSAGRYTGNPLAYYCDFKNYHNLSPESKDYFSNVDTFTATKTLNKPLSHYAYKYRFAPGNYYVDDSPDTFKCSITCTENVEIKYGPPIATKAGLCFEYEVQATSHVTCKSTPQIEQPVQKTGYCDPLPQCVHSSGKVKVRAGPDEDFDNCVSSCDGGKYTEKCSDTCYKKVYLQTNIDMLSYEDKSLGASKIVSAELAAQIHECMTITSGYKYRLNNYKKEKEYYYGCYYLNYADDSTYPAKWYPDEPDAPARWYRDNDPKRDYTKYTVVGGGFIRRKYWGKDAQKYGDYCTAKCHYELRGCTQVLSGTKAQRLTSKYLNPGVAKADNQANVATYKKAVEECKAKATCNTTTATFRVNVDEKGASVVDTLKFTDTKINNDGETYDNVIKNAKYLRKFSGCYKDGNTNKILYFARWGLSGTCIDTKTGAISNTGNNCPSGYKTYENQYCLPLNTPDVNVKWWNYYYTKLYESMNLNPADKAVGADSSKFKDECEEHCNWKVNNIDGFKPDYNIFASAIDFGYFKWDLNISCFYALNSNMCEKEPPNECKPEGYHIRTIDLRNMFPDKAGKPSAVDATGRLPGFNWSIYATHSKKDKNYTSYPSEYIKWVQGKEYTVYSDDYLDYQVRLTREKIRELKKTTAANNFKYTNYQEYTGGSKVDSVVNYKSALLRNTLQDYTILPTDDSLVCNNMHNHNSGCETFK